VLCLLVSGLLTQAANDTRHDGSGRPSRRYKRKFGMCPPKFSSIGNECYYISPNKLNWLDAYFDCKDHNSKLAEPMMYEDKTLRRALQKSKHPDDLWIGGTYNWKSSKWQWGHNGRDIEYQSFSQMVPGGSKDLKFHCALLRADIKFRWSAEKCTEKLNFICQHRMPLVSESGRYMVYDKWNKTYPDQKANEKLVYIVSEATGRNRSETGKPRIYNSAKRLLQSNPSIKPRQAGHRRNPARAKKPAASLRPNYIPPEVVGRKQHLAQYAPDATNDISPNDNGHRNGGGYHHSSAHFNIDFSPRNGNSRNPSFPRGYRVAPGTMGRVEQHVPHQHRHQPGQHRATTKRMHYFVPPYPQYTPTHSPKPTTAPTTTTTTTTAPPPPPPPPTTRSTAQPTPARFPGYPPSTTSAHRHTTHAMTAEERKIKRDRLRERLSKLTPEEQQWFWQDRANRKKLKEQQLRKLKLDRENEVVL
uniref:C-type lectin domain-containing protein n=1 Tax=Anopheles epiroticus TaxID=199890 RepID=A0A182PJZ2_9DIPT